MKNIMIAGVASGSGKTTVTCGLLKALLNRGIEAAAFKCGPDYIDPMFHSKIIGARSGNLDSYFCGRDTLGYLLKKYSGDINIIEGVMGFFDGAGENYSSYQMAVDMDIPVVLVIDCKGMSMSVGAVMKGFLTYKEVNPIKGFIFNRLPKSLEEMAKRLCSDMGAEYLGRLPPNASFYIKSRHLGLVTAEEIDNLKEKTEALAQAVGENIELDKLLELAAPAKSKAACEDALVKVRPLYKPILQKKVKIAVAYDRAFCFYYRENLDLLKELGCDIEYFSPLKDIALPENTDGLILGGGYPELYAEELSANASMLLSIRSAIEAGLPTIAECGGFMYLHRSMEDNEGKAYSMAGVIDGEAKKTDRLVRFGYVELRSKADSLLGEAGTVIKAHEFHYFDSTASGNDFIGIKASNGAAYECANVGKNIYAGFPHLYFYSNPKAAESFVKGCGNYGKNRKNQQA